MTSFPNSSEEFYALRDDRTNRCINNRKYQKTACAVYLSSAVASRLTAQTMLLCRRQLAQPVVQEGYDCDAAYWGTSKPLHGQR